MITGSRSFSRPSSDQGLSILAPTVDMCTPDLWELALPAIEREAVVIQATLDVLAVLASSLARPAPTEVVIQATLMCWLYWPHRWQGQLPQRS
ncbi:hypothetical protein EMIT053CA3_100044 [Pseudomonas donghuensis]